ncbi:RNA polymerase sigma factor [Pseudoalteromonas sp. T1lg65]|uniref:RNA polymerase sigma factor n=1 Tax=Pseudoalteromonas sp. T1lg65 TaxID=2077101 RepID=UPI003F7A7AC7
MLRTLKLWRFGASNEADDPLFEYAQSGHLCFLESVIEKYQSDIFHYLRTQTEPHVAEDICQKLWLKLIENPAIYRHAGAPKAFLFRLARNLMIDVYRKGANQQPLESCTLTVEPTFDESCGEQGLYTLIRQLPLPQREALSLQLEGFSLQEIAEIVDSPKETVKTRLRYAKESLKTKLGNEHETS